MAFDARRVRQWICRDSRTFRSPTQVANQIVRALIQTIQPSKCARATVTIYTACGLSLFMGMSGGKRCRAGGICLIIISNFGLCVARRAKRVLLFQIQRKRSAAKNQNNNSYADTNLDSEQ